jgi:flagellar biogenesis protein FliO
MTNEAIGERELEELVMEPPPAAIRLLQRIGATITRLWGSVHTTRSERKLRVSETVTLGEKRVVAVIVADERRFLIGATPNGVSLLAQLDARRELPQIPATQSGARQWVM